MIIDDSPLPGLSLRDRGRASVRAWPSCGRILPINSIRCWGPTAKRLRQLPAIAPGGNVSNRGRGKVDAPQGSHQTVPGNLREYLKVAMPDAHDVKDSLATTFRDRLDAGAFIRRRFRGTSISCRSLPRC